MEMLIIEIISVISFVFSILFVLFNKIKLTNIYILFVYFTGIMFIYSYFKRKSKLSVIILFSLFIPLIYFKDNNGIYLIIISSFILLVYGIRYLGRGDSYNFSLKLKVSYFLYLFLIFMGLINMNFRFLIYKSIPFMILYLVSMILLIRNLRNIENGLSKNKNRKQSYTYLLIIFIFSVLGSLPLVRKFIIDAVKTFYGLIIDIVFRIGHLIVMFVASIFFGFFGLFIKNETSKENINILLENIAESNQPTFEEEYIQTPRNISPILNILIIVVAIAFFTYIIIKIIKVKGERKIESVEFVEKREFIKIRKDKAKAKNTKKLYIQKDNREKIRHHYKKYLKLLEKEQMILNKSDTSLDILQKIEKERINDRYIRDLYIKSRYSSKDIDPKDIESIKKYIY